MFPAHDLSCDTNCLKVHKTKTVNHAKNTMNKMYNETLICLCGEIGNSNMYQITFVQLV